MALRAAQVCTCTRRTDRACRRNFRRPLFFGCLPLSIWARQDSFGQLGRSARLPRSFNYNVQAVLFCRQKPFLRGELGLTSRLWRKGEHLFQPQFRDKVRWQLPCVCVVCFARAGGSSGRALSRRCVARLTAAKLAAACLCLLHHPLSVGLLGAGEQRGALGTLHGGTVSQVHLVMTMSCLSEAWAECPVPRIIIIITIIIIIIWPSSICHRVRRARKKGPREVPTGGERTGPTASCYPGTLEYYWRCMYV